MFYANTTFGPLHVRDAVGWLQYEEFHVLLYAMMSTSVRAILIYGMGEMTL